MQLWHYSRGCWFRNILADGYLKLTTAGVVVGERPAVWFTIEDVWSPSAGSGQIDGQAIIYNLDGTTSLNVKTPYRKYTMQECHEHIGITRFGAMEESWPFKTWQHHKKHSGIRRDVAKALYQSAIEDGECPSQWRVSYDPVPLAACNAIQVWTGNKWIDHDNRKIYHFEKAA